LESPEILDSAEERREEALEEAENAKDEARTEVREKNFLVAFASIACVLAIVCSFFAEHQTRLGMVDCIQSNDQFVYYDTKQNRIDTLSLQIMLAQPLVGKPGGPSQTDFEKLTGLKAHEQTRSGAVLALAQAEEESSEHHFDNGEYFGYSMMLLQMTMALTTICMAYRIFSLKLMSRSAGALGVLATGYALFHLFI
jgi:hypothetical protein